MWTIKFKNCEKQCIKRQTCIAGQGAKARELCIKDEGWEKKEPRVCINLKENTGR